MDDLIVCHDSSRQNSNSSLPGRQTRIDKTNGRERQEAKQADQAYSEAPSATEQTEIDLIVVNLAGPHNDERKSLIFCSPEWCRQRNLLQKLCAYIQIAAPYRIQVREAGAQVYYIYAGPAFDSETPSNRYNELA